MKIWNRFFSKLFSSKNTLSQKQVSDSSQKSLEIPKVRVVFMGTPELAASLLLSLLEKGYNIVGVVTKKDAPVGRKKELKQSPVKEVALQHDLKVLQPEKLDGTAVQEIQALQPDLIVVAAYGKILPKALLDFPGFGCINFHTSLLPKWRGASPIQNALLNGEEETGVTLMLMDSGMDTGDILTQAKVTIEPYDTTPILTEKLLVAGTKLLLETLPQWIERRITPVKQDETKVTLCQLIEREDGRIFWADDAESIYNRFRALSPWPGIFCYWKRGTELMRLKLITISYQKHNTQTSQPLGKVFEIGEKIGVQTTTGVVFLEVVQLEGKTPMAIDEFARGYNDFVSATLE